LGWGKFTVPVLASILILGAFTVGYSIDDAFAKGQGQPKVTICHVDQETGEEKTISISTKAVSKHIANHIGDHSGECVDVPEPVCGNNVTEAPEECDDGNTVTESCNYSETSCTVCASDCSEQAGATSFCGDSNTDLANGETCDDGNNTSGDGCDALCMIETPTCEDSACDDGNECTSNGCVDDACSSVPVADGTVCGGEANGYGVCQSGQCLQDTEPVPKSASVVCLCVGPGALAVCIEAASCSEVDAAAACSEVCKGQATLVLECAENSICAMD